MQSSFHTGRNPFTVFCYECILKLVSIRSLGAKLYNLIYYDQNSQIQNRTIIAGLNQLSLLDEDIKNLSEDFDNLVKKAFKHDFRGLNRGQAKCINGILKEVSFLLKSQFMRKRKMIQNESTRSFALGTPRILIENILPDRMNDVYKRRTWKKKV